MVRLFFSNGARANAGEKTTYSVRASFAEIYNEQVYDLLNLQVRAARTVRVALQAA